jgi:hypothetical protein
LDSKRHNLRIALFVAAAALVAAVLPIWPYGYYTLLRLVVTAVAIFTIVVLGTTEMPRTVGLTLVALLFNPFIPIDLSRGLWFPIDLGVGAWFAYLAFTELSEPPSPSEPSSGAPGASST